MLRTARLLRLLSLLVLCTAAGRAATNAPAVPPDLMPALVERVDRAFVRDGTLDLDAVVTHFEDMYRMDSSVSTAELVVTKPRRTRTLRMKIWTRGEDKALIVIQAPAREEGTATLKVDRNLWNYFPRIKRTIRIPPSMMLGSWMGSDFTNDDLVRESSYGEDYEYRLVGAAQDMDGWLIEFAARPDTVGLWERFELVVTLDAKLPLRARYYDRRNELARTLLWNDVREFDGRRVPAHLVLIPEDKDGYRTELRYLDIAFGADVPDRTFSLSRLERQR